ncbi:hypothetical protein SLS60_005271 [Paraconiothyrium brasiliense]|uniref:Uncharacterized protein n=1 Tax=Paraconiothyrium brasiliense TaxID=300254 RepID=A0ABR3RH64_9PLEO
MSQPILLDDSAEVLEGWTDTPDGWTEPIPRTEIAPKKYNIICGVKVEKSEARYVLRYWQFVFGEMSWSLDAIDEYKLTEPLPVSDSNEFFDRGPNYETGRVRSAIADHRRIDARLRVMIMAKKSVASAHVVLHENFLKAGQFMPRSEGRDSLWNLTSWVSDDFNFRHCRNYFSHSFLTNDGANDLKRYSDIKEMYQGHLPFVEVLIQKLQAGLADESAWKVHTELSYSNRPAYGLDNPETEADAEEKRQIEEKKKIKASAKDTSLLTLLDSPDCHTHDDGVADDVSSTPPSPIEPTVAWLTQTSSHRWKDEYFTERRHSWSHFYIDDDGNYWA